MHKPNATILRELSGLALEGSGRDPSIEARTWAQVGWTDGGDADLAWRRGLPLSPQLMVNARTMPEEIAMFPQDMDGTCRSWNVPHLTSSRDAVETMLGTPEQVFVWSSQIDFGGLRRAHVFDGLDALVTLDGEDPVRTLLAAALLAFAIRVELALDLPRRS